jgi:hypothetical protein
MARPGVQHRTPPSWLTGPINEVGGTVALLDDQEIKVSDGRVAILDSIAFPQSDLLRIFPLPESRSTCLIRAIHCSEVGSFKTPLGDRLILAILVIITHS